MSKKLDVEVNSFEVEFSKWKKDNKQTLELFEKFPDTLKTDLFARADFMYERVNEAWGDTLSLLREQSELIEGIKIAIPEAQRLGAAKALFENMENIQLGERTKKSLEDGRKKGTLTRQTASKKNRALLIKFIEDFYQNPENPGTSWTNEQVAEWVDARFPDYAYTTILGQVKLVASAFRKKKRQPQA